MPGGPYHVSRHADRHPLQSIPHEHMACWPVASLVLAAAEYRHKQDGRKHRYPQTRWPVTIRHAKGTESGAVYCRATGRVLHRWAPSCPEVANFGLGTQPSGNLVVGDGDSATQPYEVTQDGMRCGLLAAICCACADEPVEHAGHDGQLHIHIDSHGCSKNKRTYPEEVCDIAHGVFYHRVPCVPVHQLRSRPFRPFGDEDRRLVLSYAFDRILPQLLAEFAQNALSSRMRGP